MKGYVQADTFHLSHYHWLQLTAIILTICLCGISFGAKAQPILTTNLPNQVVIIGTPVALQITVSDINSLNYQWYFDGATIPGATNASLIFDSIQVTNAGHYSVAITDAIASVSISSRTNTLTVENYPIPTTIVAWGNDSSGQTNVPPTETNVVEPFSTTKATLFLRRDGTIGDFGYEIVSPGTYSLLPNAAYVCGTPTGFSVYGLGLCTNGTPFSFGLTYLAGSSDVPPSVTNIVAVAGFNPALALMDNGSVVGWLPQPGYFPLDPGNILNSLPTLSNIVAIAMSGAHCLALASNHTLIALGSNSHGESSVPAGLTNVAAICAGLYHSVALRFDGTVVAWGDNSSNQCNVPSGLSNVVAISAGDYHTLALESNGLVVAWGDNSQGQCTVPSNLSNVVSISAGGNNSVALTKQPTVSITPISQGALIGSKATFGTYTTGYPQLNYQWQFDETNIMGATNSILTITNVQVSDQGNYSVVLSSPYGSSMSPSNASLTVYASAAATLSSPMFTNINHFQFLVSGVIGYHYAVQTNANLTGTNWVAISTNTSPFTFTDPSQLPFRTIPKRFYRAVYLP
jgi:hypothetical protein